MLLESPLSPKASLHVHLNIICENPSNQCYQWSLWLSEQKFLVKLSTLPALTVKTTAHRTRRHRCNLITTRYEEQFYTIFTTNLTPAQLEEKYGKRIVDRLNEMVEKVVFENESYRR